MGGVEPNDAVVISPMPFYIGGFRSLFYLCFCHRSNYIYIKKHFILTYSIFLKYLEELLQFLLNL